MLEVEIKYRIEDTEHTRQQLRLLGAQLDSNQSHADTYLRHPCRDFVQTKESLRIRIVDGIASVTYKGPKMDVSQSGLKARKEIEWCLAPNDPRGENMTQMFASLGFGTVTTVRKERQTFKWPDESEFADYSVTVDDVDEVGVYAEIELMIDEKDADSVEAAGIKIQNLAAKLGLTQTVSDSYLQLLLKRRGE